MRTCQGLGRRPNYGAAFGRDRVLRAPFYTLARARVARVFFAGRSLLEQPREPTRLRCGRDAFRWPERAQRASFLEGKTAVLK